MTAGVNPAYSSTSSNHGGGRPPPWSPLRCAHRLEAFGRITSNHGGRQASPVARIAGGRLDGSRLVTAGVNPAYSSTSSNHGGGRPPPWSPLRCAHRLEAFGRITSNHGGRQASPVEPPPLRASPGGVWTDHAW